MAQSAFDSDSWFDELTTATPGVYTMTAEEAKANQFGIPLAHYAQQYLFGATGIRFKVFHSIAGVPQSCKSPLVFDLLGYICSNFNGGGFLYELEDKISPSLFASMMQQHGAAKRVVIVKDLTLDGAFRHFVKMLDKYDSVVPKCDKPMVFAFDSIGGSASKDVSDKIKADGYAAKGYYDKPHIMKHLCENAGFLLGNVPAIILCVNQIKEKAAATPYATAPVKTITGGTSQIYKDGHMLNTSFKELASGDGKVLTIKTSKTSFCDSRAIEVIFRWNKYGATKDDMYGHHFEWALASAKCLADPKNGVGELRDIANVKISDKGLVTCPQLDCRSVSPEEFEASLFSEEHKEILDQLRVYQKIEVIKGLDEYVAYIKARKDAAKGKGESTEEQKVATKKRKEALSKLAPDAKPVKVSKEEEKILGAKEAAK